MARQHRVQLAVSELGGVPGVSAMSGFPGLTAYHSSVLLDGEEFSFSGSAGLVSARGTASHVPVGGMPRILNMGATSRTGRELFTALKNHFQPGTYDLLGKNCNSFSDCALFFLTGVRLSAEFNTLERIGATVPSIVQMISGGYYVPNPRALSFNADSVMKSFEPSSGTKAGPACDAECTVFRGAAGVLQEASETIFGLFLPPQAQVQACPSPVRVSRTERIEDEQLAIRLQAEEDQLLLQERYERSREDERLARSLQAEEDNDGRSLDRRGVPEWVGA